MILDILKSFKDLNKQIEKAVKDKNDLMSDEKDLLIDTMYETRNIIIAAIREINEDYVEFIDVYDETTNEEIIIDENVDIGEL